MKHGGYVFSAWEYDEGPVLECPKCGNELDYEALDEVERGRDKWHVHPHDCSAARSSDSGSLGS